MSKLENLISQMKTKNYSQLEIPQAPIIQKEKKEIKAMTPEREENLLKMANGILQRIDHIKQNIGN